MNYKWKLEPPTPEKLEAAERLAKELNISPILGRLLIERNITTVADAKKFFRPSLTELYDPFMFTDMDKAVERLNKALGRKERIMVYGDYDVDGCTAVALVYKFLQQYYSNIDYYIPDRYEEGYGVSVKGIDYAYESGVKLIIVLDCGIKAVDEIAYAKEKGIDFIICDHHVPDEILLLHLLVQLRIAKVKPSRKVPLISTCNVVMTRTGDTNPSLEDRANYAKSQGAQYLISIHLNSGGGCL